MDYAKGEGQGGKFPFSLQVRCEQFLPPPYFKYSIKLFLHLGLSSSPYSQHFLSHPPYFFLGHFSLLSILLLPLLCPMPLFTELNPESVGKWVISMTI